MSFFNKSKDKSSPEESQYNGFLVYTTSNCTQCMATKKELERNEEPYKEINIEHDQKALEKIKEFGYKQAPIVFKGSSHWSGFRPDKIKDYLTLKSDTQMGGEA